MLEKTLKSIKKSLNFEESGETLAIEISVENVSPVHDKNLKDFFDTLYREILAEITA